MLKRTYTKNGYQALVDELAELKKKRPYYLSEMVKMRELGDLSENAGYRAARGRLSRTDSRIRYLERTIAHARIAEPVEGGTVQVGHTISLYCDDGSTKKYELVGSHEADIFKNKLSIESRLGRLLLGKKKNDEVELLVSSQLKKYKIADIE